MRFIDEAKIRITAGHGGAGAVSFRREKFAPKGGPDGGDGGKGGDVTFVSSTQLSTLQDFRFRRVYEAKRGAHGSGANKAGRDGADILIRVPVGTLIKNAAPDSSGEEVFFDFTEDNQTWIACKGGRGGKGNAHFVSSTFQAPRFAQDGEEGESKELLLELKLLADAAIIGSPNAGKSTLLSRLSAARPKIADYPFTTLTPSLGVVSLPDQDGSFVLADIPGLIEGAARGTGLGHKFLKHIERTSVLIHLLDGSILIEQDLSGSAAIKKLVKQYSMIRSELGLFNKDLLERPEILVLNKSDLFESQPKILTKTSSALRKASGVKPIVISAVSGAGVKELLSAIRGKIRGRK